MRTTVLVLVALIAVASAAEINADAFAETVNGQKPSFVKFYAPCMCGVPPLSAL